MSHGKKWKLLETQRAERCQEKMDDSTNFITAFQKITMISHVVKPLSKIADTDPLCPMRNETVILLTEFQGGSRGVVTPCP